jgi:nucleotide-binding universal stress UspA family protein
MMNAILIPLDGSEFSEQIVAVVKKFLAPQANALILYRVGAPTEGHTGLPPRPSSFGMDVPMYESGQDLELAQHPIFESQEADTLRSALMDELEPVAKALRGAGYTVSVQADLGNPAECIIERANADDVDLIAMTTHGRSGISRLLFGSVAEQIVRHVSVPVLLLRPSPKKKEE